MHALYRACWSVRLARPRLWANRPVKSGRYGPVIHRCGKAHLVVLDRVEAAEGRTFAPDQLLAAGVSTWQPQESGQSELTLFWCKMGSPPSLSRGDWGSSFGRPEL
jgi:hypothetical protein